MFVWVKKGEKVMTETCVNGGQPDLTANEFTCKKTGVKKLLFVRNCRATQITSKFALQLLMKF